MLETKVCVEEDNEEYFGLGMPYNKEVRYKLIRRLKELGIEKIEGDVSNTTNGIRAIICYYDKFSDEVKYYEGFGHDKKEAIKDAYKKMMQAYVPQYCSSESAKDLASKIEKESE